MPEPVLASRTFPPTARLKTSGEFRRVQADGRFVDLGPLVVRVAPRPVEGVGPPPGRLGLAVSRRVGNAVVRNLVKRRLRELFRPRQASFTGLDLMVTARPSAATASFDELGRAFDELVRRLPVAGRRG